MKTDNQSACQFHITYTEQIRAPTIEQCLEAPLIYVVSLILLWTHLRLFRVAAIELFLQTFAIAFCY